MNIPSEATWAQFAENLPGPLTVLNGMYTVDVKCENGETFSGMVEFTGTTVDDATYRMMSPSPSQTTQTATTTSATTP